MPYADGRSRVPLFQDPKRTDWADDILCAYYGGEFLYTQRIAINQRYKYVFDGFDFDELYDLERDPAEMRNVVDTSEYRKQTDDMRQPAERHDASLNTLIVIAYKHEARLDAVGAKIEQNSEQIAALTVAIANLERQWQA